MSDESRGSNMHNSRNYQMDLNNLIESLDPIIKKAWNANAEVKIMGMWGKILLGPFSQVKTIINILRDKKFSFVPLMVTGPGAIVIGWLGWDTEAFIQYFGYEYANWILIGGTVFIWYAVTASLHFLEMAKLDSPHFHIGAFARLRKAEFAALKPFIQGDQRFTFQGLKDWVYDPARIGTAHVELVEKEKKWLQEREEFESGVRALQKEFERLQSLKNSHIEDLESRLTFTFRLLEKIKTNLSRFANGILTENDLDFICPYTLYKLEGGTLVKKADVGTSGNGRDINISEKTDYACVIALNHHEGYFYGRLGADRSVFSYRMSMPDESIWVINFHINERDHQIMEIFFGNGIIDTQTLFDLVHVHCRLIFMYKSGQEISA